MSTCSRKKLSLYLKLTLLLDEFFKQLLLVDEKSLQGQLVDGEPFEATLPTFAEIKFSKLKSQLKSLTVSSCNLIKDKSELLCVNTGNQS